MRCARHYGNCGDDACNAANRPAHEPSLISGPRRCSAAAILLLVTRDRLEKDAARCNAPLLSRHHDFRNKSGLRSRAICGGLYEAQLSTAWVYIAQACLMRKAHYRAPTVYPL